MADDGQTPIRILLVEDSDIDADLIAGHLRKANIVSALTRIREREALENVFRGGEFDVVVHDYAHDGREGYRALSAARAASPNIPFIFVSGVPGEEHAANALKHGATDYILKRNLSRLGAAIKRAVADVERDVERSETADELARIDRDFQNALRAGRFGTWRLDIATMDLFTSDVCRANFGRNSSDPFTYADLREAIHPEDRQRMADTVDASLKTGGDYDIEYRILTPAGEERWIAIRGQPSFSVDGKPVSMSGVSADVTDRVKLEVELRHMNETLERRVHERTRELSATQDALRQSQKMEAVGQLTGGVAHDFNNLLASIIGGLELMERRIARGDPTGALKYGAAAKESARRAASLTQRLLAFSRRQTLEPKVVDPNVLVSGLQDLIKRSIGPDIALEVIKAPDLWHALIDAPQLENAILNLCINARDAMAGLPGHLEIRTENCTISGPRSNAVQALSPGEYVCIAVSDAGTGMTPDVLARAFDPFFTTKPLGAGTGLGLSMVYGFVQQSGGEVRIDSKVGVGTTVRMYLPRFNGEAPEVVAPDGVGAMSGGQGETVLVVDDEAALRMVMRDTLEESGYRPLEAKDGVSALRILNSRVQIDLLVTDVGLPGGINGRQLAEMARQSRPDLKVLFVTGYAERGVLDSDVFKDGMELLRKPFPPAGLTDKVKTMLGRLHT